MFKIAICLLHTENVDTPANTTKYENNLLLLLPLHHDVWCDILGKFGKQKECIQTSKESH
jgi:hypothetical protein